MARAHTGRARVAPGFEALAAEELAEHGIGGTEEPGGVRFPITELGRVLQHSRLASAVTVTLGRVKIAKLPDALRGFPWRDHLIRGQRVEVAFRGMSPKGLDRKSAAVIARAASPRSRPGRPPPPLSVLIVAGGAHAEVTVVAGRELWKRGWRTNPGRAPLRENLAAGVLRALAWNPEEALVDPFCGSGTFPIEAAHLAFARPPGAQRTFAAQWFAGYVAPRPPGKKRGASVSIHGSDRDPRQLAAARENADRARVGRNMTLREASFVDLEPPARSGLLVMNPPYGARLAASHKTYRHIGAVLADRWTGWRYGVLAPDPTLARTLPRGAEVRLGFRNGGIRVWLLSGEVG